MRVYVTVRCPSVRLSVSSIDSSSDVQLVCCSSGAGDRYRSISIPAAEHSSGQRHAVIRGTEDRHRLVHQLVVESDNNNRTKSVYIRNSYDQKSEGLLFIRTLVHTLS